MIQKTCRGKKGYLRKASKRSTYVTLQTQRLTSAVGGITQFQGRGVGGAMRRVPGKKKTKVRLAEN